jgi:hypothetical protein
MDICQNRLYALWAVSSPDGRFSRAVLKLAAMSGDLLCKYDK